MKIIDKSAFDELIDGLIESDDRPVVGVQWDGEKYVFDRLESSEELALDYDMTMLSPKKYLMPQRETLIGYCRSNDGYEMKSEPDDQGRIIVGVHPYDLVAIEHLDKILIDTLSDEPYRRKRENSVLIGVNIQDVPEESFAGSMGTATTDSGYDLFLTDLEDRVAVDIGTFEGKQLLERVPNRSATHEEVQEVGRIEEELSEQFEHGLTFPPAELPTLLEANYDDMEFWESYAETCLSCGTCNVVCPTCYCFNVDMHRDLGEERGRQQRRWDGCLLEDFASIAQGENFREEVAQRHRHRFMRKGWYVYERYGDIACVGCGRCTRQCVANVADPCEVYNDLWKKTNA